MHKRASVQHHAESEVLLAIEDLMIRRDAFPDLKVWVHANAKDFGMKNTGPGALADIRILGAI